MNETTRQVSAVTGANEDLNLLLPAVASGDKAAFNRLYAATSQRALGLCVRLIRDRAQAEEVLQEVFLEVWRSAPAYDPKRGSAISWLLTITHRKSVDRIRASQAAHDRDLKVGIKEYEAETDTVAEDVETLMMGKDIANALGHLTELQRQVITLAYYRGLTVREIADQLKVPANTIKTRLRDGMIRLRDELGVTAR